MSELKQIKLNKESKKDISVAIGDLYRATRKINILAGNASLDSSRLETQLAAVEEELQELIDGYEARDLVMMCDAVVDSLVTVSETISLLDQEAWLTQDNPLPYLLNKDDTCVEVLIRKTAEYYNEDNFIDLLGVLEDIAVSINAPMCDNIYSVIDSNNSKFITTKELDESGETEFTLCEKIESQGRYEDVYSEIVEYEGEEYVVFKSKYDKKNDKSFPQGKFIKPLGFFKEPEIKGYA